MDADLSIKDENTIFQFEDYDIIVPANDPENHIEGSKHQFRIRQKNDERKNVEGQFECSICNSKFTNIEFYTIHMGSKTHKRNLRKMETPIYKKVTNKAEDVQDSVIKPVGRPVSIQGNNEYLTVDNFQDPCYYKSTREEYRPKNAKNQAKHKKPYILSTVAYSAVTLALDPTVQDFKISLYDKEWEDFGDTVIEVQFKETTDHPPITTIFAIQFKYISNNAKAIYSFNDGRFNCADYISQIAEIEGKNDPERIKFVVFTTASTQPELEQSIKIPADVIHRNTKECPCGKKEEEIPVFAKTLSNRRKLVVNTSKDNVDIYFFYSTDDIHVIPKLYIYTRQKKLESFSKSIDDAVNNMFEDSKGVEIHRDFIKYIEYWSEGYPEGNYKLKKEDVLVKIGHLLLFESKIPPQVNKHAETKNYDNWNQAINSSDVTVLAQHPVILFKICEPMNKKIEKELGLSIDTTTSTVRITEDNLKSIQNTVLEMYLFEETLGNIHDDILLDIIYDVFWKAGMISIILQAKDVKHQDYILEVITLLKSLGLTRRYFLITSDQNIKTSIKYYKTLSFFVSLDDVARKIPSFLLDYVKIGVTDTFSLSMREVQDNDIFFQKRINAHEFFDMSLGEYSFKSVGNHLSRKEEGVEDAKLVLNEVIMNKLKEEIESKKEINTLVDNEPNGSKRWLHGINPAIFY